jgi:sucrose-6-phosphate hydrolase SacC (GH32 family)
MSETTPEIKYSSYTPAQKKASQLYRLKNKEKINEQRKKYYLTRKETDPNFLEYKRTKAKEYYEKKKLDKVVIPEVKSDVEVLVVKVDPIITDVIVSSPVVDSVIKVPDVVIKKKKVKKTVTVVEPLKV